MLLSISLSVVVGLTAAWLSLTGCSCFFMFEPPTVPSPTYIFTPTTTEVIRTTTHDDPRRPRISRNPHPMMQTVLRRRWDTIARLRPAAITTTTTKPAREVTSWLVRYAVVKDGDGQTTTLYRMHEHLRRIMTARRLSLRHPEQKFVK